MTLKQLGAKRLNRQRSAGPRSAEGKDRSRWNALKSGIHAQSQILPGEDRAALETLSGEFCDYRQPDTPTARELLDNIIHSAWLSRRYRCIDAQLMKYEIDTTYKPNLVSPWGQALGNASTRFPRLQTRINATGQAGNPSLGQLRPAKPGFTHSVTP